MVAMRAGSDFPKPDQALNLLSRGDPIGKAADALSRIRFSPPGSMEYGKGFVI